MTLRSVCDPCWHGDHGPVHPDCRCLCLDLCRPCLVFRHDDCQPDRPDAPDRLCECLDWRHRINLQRRR